MDAIVEYANQCGETVSNLVRKAMIREASFMDGFDDLPEYRYEMRIPDVIANEDKFVEDNYNRIRKILGLNAIQL